MTLLPWLPLHDDLTGALKGLRSLPHVHERLRGLIGLAGHQRDVLATAKIDRLAADCLAGGDGADGRAEGLTPMRLAILPSHSVEHLLPSIRVAGLGRNLALDVKLGGYGLHRQVLLHGNKSWKHLRRG